MLFLFNQIMKLKYKKMIKNPDLWITYFTINSKINYSNPSKNSLRK